MPLPDGIYPSINPYMPALLPDRIEQVRSLIEDLEQEQLRAEENNLTDTHAYWARGMTIQYLYASLRSFDWSN